MMLQEFNELTGFFPTPSLYAFIEAEYIDGPWKDKQSFCRAYKLNLDGLAEKIMRKAHEGDRMTEANHSVALRSAMGAAEEWKQEAERIQKVLDRELEWKPYHNAEEFSDEDFNQLYDDKNTNHLSESAAKDLVADEFGFNRDKIQIQRDKDTYEVNRHRQLRRRERISRAPLYNASDWNYVKFTVCGIDYEMQNGELRRV